MTDQKPPPQADSDEHELRKELSVHRQMLADHLRQLGQITGERVEDYAMAMMVVGAIVAQRNSNADAREKLEASEAERKRLKLELDDAVTELASPVTMQKLLQAKRDKRAALKKHRLEQTRNSISYASTMMRNAVGDVFLTFNVLWKLGWLLLIGGIVWFVGWGWPMINDQANAKNNLEAAIRKLNSITTERDSFASARDRALAQLTELETQGGQISLQSEKLADLQKRREEVLGEIEKKEGLLGRLSADVTALDREAKSLEVRAREAQKRLEEVRDTDAVRLTRESLLTKTELLQNLAVLWYHSATVEALKGQRETYQSQLKTLLSWCAGNAVARADWWDETGEGRKATHRDFTRQIVETLAQVKFPFGDELQRKLQTARLW